MKQLINGWKIINSVSDSSEFVLVFNFSSGKEIENYGVSFKITKNGWQSRVGIWQPKGTNLKTNK